jgi:chromosome condensin MukBEF complex kleisin-like MukF subunit
MIKSDVESYINDLAFEHGIIFIDITDILFVMREYLESHPNSKVVDVMKIIVKAVKNG